MLLVAGLSAAQSGAVIKANERAAKGRRRMAVIPPKLVRSLSFRQRHASGRYSLLVEDHFG
jgi:hypothetical protein